MLKKTALASFVLFAVMAAAAFPVFAGGKPDLKGQEIVIGNYWTDYDVATYKPGNEVDERQLEWRKKILAENGFKMKEQQVSDWGGMLQTVGNSIMAGKPAASAFWIPADWAMTLYRRGLLAPFPAADFLKTETEVVGKQVAYNQDIAKLFTFGGKQYALTIGSGGNDGVYFNKRLFKEAGLDPDLPYDLQKSGRWTWDEFLRISKILTRDTRNTGRINTWAMTSDLLVNIMDEIVYSNGGDYIGKNAQGKFYNASNTPALIEALQFALKLKNEGVMMPRPEGSNWDWYWPAFHDGTVAMLMEPEWRRGQLQDMKDDWGYVVFPKGPRQKDYRFPTDGNVLVIPATFKPAEVEKILYAINLWSMPVTDNWKEGLYGSFRDRRAVDETMAIYRNPKNRAFRTHNLIPGLSTPDISYQMWSYNGEPAQLIEEVSTKWNALIDDANTLE